MVSQLESIRECIRQYECRDELESLKALIATSAVTREQRQAISADAANLVQALRDSGQNSLMEKFLAEYGLSTREGVALMCLAEALLRVPDTSTINALIEDKIAFGEWQSHLGKSPSGLINGSTWALMLTGKLIEPTGQQSLSATLRGLVRRLGEPVVRGAVEQAMKELGRQFVLGSDIDGAMKRAARQEARGFHYSYDMLGEAALTQADADAYLDAYSQAIRALAKNCVHPKSKDNPGISIKLSALHPRYEFAQRERVRAELTERVFQLALQARDANMGFNIDAEEAERLDLSLDVIAAVLARDELAGWDGFGVVVQAFGQRASAVIDWLYALAAEHQRQIMVRLVKGAYWDREIKRAQVLGLDNFPVFTRKAHSDMAYLCCAEQLLGMTDRIFPQFATHNAHSMTTILALTRGMHRDSFEFQRLHGMGEALHSLVQQRDGRRCRIYAPVGEHRDLLAYLVRRLLENGANSSFVNQVADPEVAPEVIAEDPFLRADPSVMSVNGHIRQPVDLYGPLRRNARGWNIDNANEFARLFRQRGQFLTQQWEARPLVAPEVPTADSRQVFNPANPQDCVGSVTAISAAGVTQVIDAAAAARQRWAMTPVSRRAAALLACADLFEEHAPELFAIIQREAGKTLADAIGEVREAVDFARYYAEQAATLADENSQAAGIIGCISPWNFPLAIFAGQIFAALVAGNCVVAKPAEQTPLIAARAVALMHQAGIPQDVLQLVPGRGSVIGTAMTSDPRVNGLCFTGSTDTAMIINRNMAVHQSPTAALIAETGGLNAMIVDSTALAEQVVRDVLASAFQSAGQRCSALRMLYLQEEVADGILTMLGGAMDELTLGNPWQLSTDIGPVIDEAAREQISRYIDQHRSQVVKQLAVPAKGSFVAPTVIRVQGIEDLEREIFGPVLHVATYKADELNQVIAAINRKGYGLTFGLHTRIDRKIEAVTQAVHAGNLYVNRNQIGAIVGSQPFGGEGLSGTGPKAGGPNYLHRFRRRAFAPAVADDTAAMIDRAELQTAMAQLAAVSLPQSPEVQLSRYQAVRSLFANQLEPSFSVSRELPGPTGESNQLRWYPRGVVLCLGPSVELAQAQAVTALATGNAVVVIAAAAAAALQPAIKAGLPLRVFEGGLEPAVLQQLQDLDVVASNATDELLRAYRQALAQRSGALIPLVTELYDVRRYILERHVCIDTTAAGGNASLIAASE